jgi:hypothetical protein
MVEPGGKRITRPRCQRTKWPPRSVLNSPKLVTTHWPQDRFPGSVRFGDGRWGKVYGHGGEDAALKVPTQERTLVEEDVEVRRVEFVHSGGVGGEHVGLEASNACDGGRVAEFAECLSVSFRVFHIQRFLFQVHHKHLEEKMTAHLTPSPIGNAYC